MVHIILVLLLALSASAGVACAGELFEVGADSLLFSQIGSLVRVTDPGIGGATYHAFEVGNWIRIYGVRDYGSEEW